MNKIIENRPKRNNNEKVAYWFFRLNGCLTIENFIIHQEKRGQGGSQRTDADLLAVRFPYRAELAYEVERMIDHPVFDIGEKIDFIIAEIKTGICRLNGPWTDPERSNMQRVLLATGWYPRDMVDTVAKEVYVHQYFTDERSQIRLFAIGKEKNQYLPTSVVQLTWEEILLFIYDRFNRYLWQKSSHQQWDNVGRTMYSLSRSRPEDVFLNKMYEYMHFNVGT